MRFATRGAAGFVETAAADHGRIETRRMGCQTALNATLDFPSVGQVFLIERESIKKKPASARMRPPWGSRVAPPAKASPQRLRAIHGGHWSIAGRHYLIDWNYDEDRGRIRTGFGPENLLADKGRMARRAVLA